MADTLKPVRIPRPSRRCVGGAGSCPPEDCGGVHGFADFLIAIGDPNHPEHQAMRQWSAGRFNTGPFDPAAVVFDDPKKRWKIAFGGGQR